MMRRRKYAAALAAALLAGGVGWWLWSEHQEDTHRFITIREHVLYRSRQPDVIEWSAIERRAISRVVNLRHRQEDPEDFDRELAQCRAVGVTMINIPMQEIIPSDEELARFLTLTRDGQGGVLVHCAQGRARTGIMVAAFRVVVDGWTPQQAYDEMASYWPPVSASATAPDAGPGNRGERRLAMLEKLQRDRAEWLAQTAPPTTSTTRNAP